jgi:Zn-dependent alcohol dehydrogenase
VWGHKRASPKPEAHHEDRAAVLRKGGTPWEITELELDEPKVNEVLVRMEAAGLCHSDEHIRARGRARLPMVGGHEGAGVVVQCGPSVTRLYDIPMILSLWHEGHIKLPELITKRYALEEINEGYADLMEGRNLRGVLVHQH